MITELFQLNFQSNPQFASIEDQEYSLQYYAKTTPSWPAADGPVRSQIFAGWSSIRNRRDLCTCANNITYHALQCHVAT